MLRLLYSGIQHVNIQKMCLSCFIPYVLKKTSRISVHRPRMKPSGGCQSFWCGFWAQKVGWDKGMRVGKKIRYIQGWTIAYRKGLFKVFLGECGSIFSLIFLVCHFICTAFSPSLIFTIYSVLLVPSIACLNASRFLFRPLHLSFVSSLMHVFLDQYVYQQSRHFLIPIQQHMSAL